MYGGESESPRALVGMDKKFSITERLQVDRDVLKNRLAEVESALDMLKQHPETQQVLDALAKLGVR